MQYAWRRCINETKMQALRERLTEEDRNNVLNCPNVNDAYDNFIDILHFKEALNDCCPVRKKIRKKKKNRGKTVDNTRNK